MGNIKLRKCKQCGERSPVSEGVVTPLTFFCSIDCAVEYSQKQADKAHKRQQGKAHASHKRKIKAARQAHKADKERVKRKSEWLADLQAVFNKYVRLRDAAEGCISCDKPASWDGQWHASHYYSRGHSSALRYNLWNVHKSCSVCNNHMSGNEHGYTPAIIFKIGSTKFEWLVRHKADNTTYDIEWIKRAIKIARRGIKRIERRKSSQPFQ